MLPKPEPNAMASRDRGYSCNQFVENPPEYLKCRVCRNVLFDPQLTECCGRNVCRPCVDGVLEVGCPCPQCRQPNVRVSFNRKCRNDIDELRIYCGSRANGCQWVDKLENLERHLTECAYVEEPCPFGCGRPIQRRQLHTHKDSCEHFKIECRCGKVYERRHRSRHMSVCEFTQVKCPFNIVGCKVELMNKDMHHHFSTSLPEHYALVAALSQDIEAKVAEMKVVVRREHDEMTACLNNEIDGLNAAILTARDKIALLQDALRKGDEELGDLQRTQATVKNSFDVQAGTSNAEIRALCQALNHLQFDSKVRLFGAPLPRPHPIYSRPPEAPPTNPMVPPLTFTILDFPSKKKYDAVVYSPPFLTHHQGYKLCLQVFCNGDDRGKGKFLSIFAYLMKGEYDDFLSWPFSGSVTVEVRNLLKRTHDCVKTIAFNSRTDPSLETRSRVTGDEHFSSTCVGHSNFMFLKVLFPSFSLFPDFQYIRDNCLKIDVSSVKVF